MEYEIHVGQDVRKLAPPENWSSNYTSTFTRVPFTLWERIKFLFLGGFYLVHSPSTDEEKFLHALRFHYVEAVPLQPGQIFKVHDKLIDEIGHYSFSTPAQLISFLYHSSDFFTKHNVVGYNYSGGKLSMRVGKYPNTQGTPDIFIDLSRE